MHVSHFGIIFFFWYACACVWCWFSETEKPFLSIYFVFEVEQLGINGIVAHFGL